MFTCVHTNAYLPYTHGVAACTNVCVCMCVLSAFCQIEPDLGLYAQLLLVSFGKNLQEFFSATKQMENPTKRWSEYVSEWVEKKNK